MSLPHRTRWAHTLATPTVLMLAALGSLVAAGADRQDGVDSELELRVIRAARATYFHGMSEDIALSEVGAEGLPVLRRLLTDPDFPRRDNVVAMLGYLGGAEDAEALVSHLQSPPASLSIPEEDRALLLAPQSLGQLAGSGDLGALQVLLEATAPEAEGAGVLLRAASHGADPATLRDDLLEMSLRGLAFSGRQEARRRLQEIAEEQIRPAGGRSLTAAARAALRLFDRLHAGPTAASEAGATGGDPGVEPSTGSGTLDTEPTVHEAALSYANHVAVTDPMDDARLDDILGLASLRAGRGDFAEDTACCIELSRSGSALQLGTAGDGLDVIDDDTELRTVLNDPVARFKVVRAINYCGGNGTNIIGCAWRPGNGAAVVRMSSRGSEAVLWIHEFGHNVGLSHNTTSSRYLMYGTDYGTNDGLSQDECSRYHYPSASAGITPQDVGVCTDADGDLVQDHTDNCPGAANHDQQDSNGDGLGDACETGSDPVCGNGVVEAGEDCDGTDLGGQSCEGRGFDGGTLACNPDCTLDESGCTICGDGVRDAGEACDGTDFGGDSCQSRGYDAGYLSCRPDCTVDESGCYCEDLDGDGVSACDGDCDDSDPTIHPGADEVCGDGIDQDCNGRDKAKGCKPNGGGGGGKKGGGESCRNGVDDDGDGLIDCADGDCASKKFCTRSGLVLDDPIGRVLARL